MNIASFICGVMGGALGSAEPVGQTDAAVERHDNAPQFSRQVASSTGELLGRIARLFGCVSERQVGLFVSQGQAEESAGPSMGGADGLQFNCDNCYPEDDRGECDFS